jgi:hypothetical protein
MVLRPRGGRWGEECGGMAHARAGALRPVEAQDLWEQAALDGVVRSA